MIYPGVYYYAVATFTASRKHSPTTIITAMIKYFTAIIKYCMYSRTCTLLLTYPTQTPLLFSGSRLDRECFLRFICAHGVAGGLGSGSPPTEKRSNLYDRISTPHPTPFHCLTYPSFAFGVPLRSSVFPAVYMCTRCSWGFGGRQSPNRKTIEFLQSNFYAPPHSLPLPLHRVLFLTY